jgi:hypothetical protein
LDGREALGMLREPPANRKASKCVKLQTKTRMTQEWADNMRDNVIPHPKRDLMIEAKFQREIADSREADVLHDAIVDTVYAYSDYLEQHGLIWEHDPDDRDLPRLKATALVVTLEYGDGNNCVDITLKDSALDRVYGDGVDPDPDFDADPPLPSRS